MVDFLKIYLFTIADTTNLSINFYYVVKDIINVDDANDRRADAWVARIVAVLLIPPLPSLGSAHFPPLLPPTPTLAILCYPVTLVHTFNLSRISWFPCLGLLTYLTFLPVV